MQVIIHMTQNRGAPLIPGFWAQFSAPWAIFCPPLPKTKSVRLTIDHNHSKNDFLSGRFEFMIHDAEVRKVEESSNSFTAGALAMAAISMFY